MAEGAALAGYIPKLYLTIPAAVSFGGACLAFWIRWWFGPKQKWLLTLCIGGTTMAAGFLVRLFLTWYPTSLAIFVVEEIVIFLSPCAFLAHNYSVLPRLAVQLKAERYLWFSVKHCTWIFIISDIVTFNLQGSGSGLTSNPNLPDAIRKLGFWVVMAGNVLQLLSFLTFCLLVTWFGYCIHREYVSGFGEADTRRGILVKLYLVLAFSSHCLLVRTVYRTVEYAQGPSGTIRTVEWCFYAYDTLPNFGAIVLWTVHWPANRHKESRQHRSHTQGEGLEMETL